MSGALSRRNVLIGGTAIAGGIGLAGLARSGAAGAQVATATARADLDVHVLVVDGMRPDELNASLTPNLTGLAADGTRYQNASAIMVAETLPNHAAMMTGVLPYRNGVPANKIYDPEVGDERELGRASDLRASTVLGRLRTELGLTTASVLSKDYLHGLFGGQASVEWDPFPLLPITDHAPDHFTTEALIQIVGEHSPRMTFTNLGDVDRVGHMDVSGTSIRIARHAALRGTDAAVQKFVDFLRASGRWERSVLIVLADHSMDWSSPLGLIGLDHPLNTDPALAGRIRIAQNGGVDLVYFVGDDAERADAVERIKRIALGVPGVESVHSPAEFDLGDLAGDVVALCAPGWRFSDPTPLSNLIPGNHGHTVTLPIPFFVAGGHPMVGRGLEITDVQARTMDVAPTVASLFGLSAPEGGWDGASRIEGLVVA
ncbi:alkaline phosphatase family protein [Rhodococcus spongiicola]|uniref:Alkaline phosphatase family protein n=1 Tax=Rhodococcus spongiicola TaxID=2487352 RepID=A0A3S3CPE9_9NOCA|nr:alkaline phosphatase family protein [Rhodococcus spongiicola]RVW02454.1 alkaline phosphatase family protein [Rhodococcus spongiicola]